MSERTTFPVVSPQITGPADLITALPYLVGYHPIDSLCVLGISGARIEKVLCVDLTTARPHSAVEMLSNLRSGLDLTAVIAVGYGTAERVTPVMDTVRRICARNGVRLHDALRVTHGRYWSYLCEYTSCCSPDGMPLDRTGRAAVEAIYAGMVAWPSRQALEDSIAPLRGARRDSMRAETIRACDRYRVLVHRRPVVRGALPLLHRQGYAAVDRGLAQAGDISDYEAAWLTVVLQHPAIRKYAWARCEAAQINLWADLTRRAEPEFVCAPAALLASSAWAGGNSTLAAMAIDRALSADPADEMANLIDYALRCGLPPGTPGPWAPQP